MNGLTVRWPLGDAPAGVGQELARHVASAEHASYTGRSGLRFKVWRTVPGEWFEAVYVFASDEACADFEAELAETVAGSEISRIIGSPPVLVQPCEIVGVAEGWDGFEASARL
ncbi:hypothetical protein GHK92_07635 [Nocardioides sp. dk4132]|uniref:hypothetical protein n=1 Tax=unclassified Nocardioides TaxID=2615069 RepID=UPI001295A2E4|nr:MULTISPECIES: hypothetical protein [unclassified Nocardioides]MQW75740.1 hypothetical protein [Nocardioides sp. dk4132]QGA08624.1 hypothetical protein GFH29_15385 [Nocardioides sp. dk884]